MKWPYFILVMKTPSLKSVSTPRPRVAANDSPGRALDVETAKLTNIITLNEKQHFNKFRH